jgi:bifunctional non-homologous end joining protein LigD
MLATPAPRRPRAGPAWAHEIKWDGMRVLADVRGPAGHAVTSRNEQGRHRVLPRARLRSPGRMTISSSTARSSPSTQGRPSFRRPRRAHARCKDRRKAERLAVHPAGHLHVVFDLLRLFGQDLTGTRRGRARRPLLDRLDLTGITRGRCPRPMPTVAQLLAATAEQDLEGLVSKRRGAAYVPRSPLFADWLKVEPPSHGGLGRRRRLAPRDRATPPGSALCLHRPPGPGGLALCRAGWAPGSPAGPARAMADLLAPLTSARLPVRRRGAGPRRASDVTWVEPLRRRRTSRLPRRATGGGRLRHPTYRRGPGRL